MITIRNALISDEDLVYKLINELEGTELDRGNFNAIFRANISAGDIYYFAAEEDGRITGFISLHIQKLLHHVSKIAEVQELVVTKDARRSGTGSLLLEKAKETAIQNGCTLLEVCCNKTRTESHAFYESQGMNGSHYKFTFYLN